MRLFRRKKTNRESKRSGPPCSYCGSTDTGVAAYHGGDQPDHVRIWRGQRYWTCRCSACGRDFYIEEPAEGLTDQVMSDNPLIDNEEALLAAEEELKRQIEEDGDRRYR